MRILKCTAWDTLNYHDSVGWSMNETGGHKMQTEYSSRLAISLSRSPSACVFYFRFVKHSKQLKWK